MPRISKVLVTLAFISLWGTGVFGAPPAHFPESQRAAVSPDKKYSIHNRNSDQEPNHTLYLRNGSGADEKILDYGRHVDVMWSPGSDLFFVNDYSGSSEATCLLFYVDGLRRLDVTVFIRKSGDADILSSDHLYITCKKWDKSNLVVSVSGRGEKYPKGFDREYFINPKTQEVRTLGKAASTW